VTTVWVKICGLTTEEDALAVAASGADAAGVIVSADSPRSVDRVNAQRIFSRTPELEKVLVTVSSDEEEILDLSRELRPDALQLHGGDAMPDFFATLRGGLLRSGLGRMRIIAALGVDRVADREELLRRARSLVALSDAILLDTRVPGVAGGTGEPHDWGTSGWVRERLPMPVILAGGLNPANVGEAISVARPAGVDVASGVESQPGVKDHDLIASFVSSVRRMQ
jgi:phosphoribosylanthranilate isomerase